jgi:DNA repair exonuclease SbcCD ATPase subunit
MSPQNPQVAEELGQARDELERLKAEKRRLYPPDPHPFVEPSRYPREYTAQQIEYRNRLIARIEELEQRIEELQDRLYRN